MVLIKHFSQISLRNQKNRKTEIKKINLLDLLNVVSKAKTSHTGQKKEQGKRNIGNKVLRL